MRERAWQPSAMSLRRESRRLSRAFGALVLAIGPAGAAIQACSDTSAATDAMTNSDATAESAAADAETGAAEDAKPTDDGTITPIDAACGTIAEMLDAGPDAEPDADPGCRYTLPCGLPEAATFEIVGCSCFQIQPDPGTDASLGCWVPEENGCMADVFVPKAGASVTFQCLDCFGGGGRRPAGLRRPRAARRGSLLGDYFARMAHDEAASIRAFQSMHDELVRFGAPAELALAAARSACDEARHARMMARRARALGSTIPSPRVRRLPARSLEAIARENAVEGCINETYGALQMRWQAERAHDPSLRRLFSKIAADETRHAALSWMVARWAESQLDAPARARVLAARSRALRSLRRRLDRSEPAIARVDKAVGRPARAHALALLDGLAATLA